MFSAQDRPPSPPGALDRRDGTRAEVAFLGRASGEVARSIARIHDLSANGCRLQAFARFQRGEPLVLVLPGLIVRAAVVVWTEDDHAGCRFAAPLEPAELAQLGAWSDLARPDGNIEHI